MQAKQLVVVGTSAGGLEALRLLVGALPADFAAPICIVMHTSPQSPSVLHEILNRSGRLKAVNSENGVRLQPGHIYVAPPDCHLVVEPGRLRVTKGPRENRFRPAVDPLFRSAAQVFGPAAIGVILTGHLDDGTAGLWAIKQLGGTAIVQDPEDALYPSMPANALNYVNVDYIVPLAEIVPILVRLTTAPKVEAERPEAPEHVEVEVKIAKEQNPLDAGLEEIAKPSAFACPECHGVLLELQEGGRIRFRCHTGHAYSVDSLLAAISEGIEDSLWNAIRSLEEGALLMSQMAEHLKGHDGGRDTDAKRLGERAEEAHRQSDLVRKLVMEREPLAATHPN
jgi:two-component system, chemotaxis family, protein-glutamate methylesterase/glutaminase